jgi:hypothetical protein
MNKLGFLSPTEQLSYWDAMDFLYKNYSQFPSSIPSGGPHEDISIPYFKSHRFIKCDSGEIVFGDCIVPGINRNEFIEYREMLNTEIIF